MSRPEQRVRFEHPLRKDQITEDNYQQVANDLFFGQIEQSIDQYQSVMKYGYGDDDTDYLTTQLDATQTLLHLSYEGTREELIDFLFDDQAAHDTKYIEAQAVFARWTAIKKIIGEEAAKNFYDSREFEPARRGHHLPVTVIDSAGGLSDDLQKYSALNDPDD